MGNSEYTGAKNRRHSGFRSLLKRETISIVNPRMSQQAVLITVEARDSNRSSALDCRGIPRTIIRTSLLAVR